MGANMSQFIHVGFGNIVNTAKIIAVPSPNPAETTLPAVKGWRIDGDGKQSDHKALEKRDYPFRCILCSCGGAADYGFCFPGSLPPKYLPAA